MRKGQVLFIIDQVPYKAALETAVANVESAKAGLATAQLTYDSKKELFAKKVVSEFDLRTAEKLMAYCQGPVGPGESAGGECPQ